MSAPNGLEAREEKILANDVARGGRGDEDDGGIQDSTMHLQVTMAMPCRLCSVYMVFSSSDRGK